MTVCKLRHCQRHVFEIAEDSIICSQSSDVCDIVYISRAMFLRLLMMACDQVNVTLCILVSQ